MKGRKPLIGCDVLRGEQGWIRHAVRNEIDHRLFLPVWITGARALGLYHAGLGESVTMITWVGYV